MFLAVNNRTPIQRWLSSRKCILLCNSKCRCKAALGTVRSVAQQCQWRQIPSTFLGSHPHSVGPSSCHPLGLQGSCSLHDNVHVNWRKGGASPLCVWVKNIFLQTQRIWLSLILIDIAHLYSIGVVPIHISINNVWDYLFSCTLIIHISCLVGEKWYLIMILIAFFLFWVRLFISSCLRIIRTSFPLFAFILCSFFILGWYFFNLHIKKLATIISFRHSSFDFVISCVCILIQNLKYLYDVTYFSLFLWLPFLCHSQKDIFYYVCIL